jgi:hypothetical protein
MKIKDENGVLLGADLTPEQRAFILRVSRLVPQEQSRITRYMAFVNAERRDEATLVAKRIWAAMPETHPNREQVFALLIGRLDELKDW